MSDRHQEELLSAYLDGELNAAERAEVEALLASNPAARQGLEELRALSAILQSLPRQPLGEDLRPQVLRAAERRILTDAELESAGVSEAAPVPLTKAILRRFVNGRTVLWLSLTAAVALMLWIDERQRRAPLGGQGDREVAVAPAKSALREAKPGPPPTIQAAHDAPGSAAQEADVPREKAALQTPSAPAMPGSVGSNAMMAAKAESASELAQSAPAADRFTEPFRRGPSGQFLPRSPGAAAATARLPQKTDSLSQRTEESGAADHVFVVYCTITRDAAKKQAFENLLRANGIAWEKRSKQNAADGVAEASPDSARGGKPKTPAIQDADRKLAKPPSVDDAKEETRVYAEAALAKIEAVLAGMSAQPEVFSSVSIRREQTEVPQAIPAESQDRRKETKAPRPSQTAEKGMLAEASPRGGDLPSLQTPAAARQRVPSATRQPVLFVVRVLEDEPSSPSEDKKP